MKRSAPLQRHTRIKPISPKRKSRVGKLGIVRLRGKDVEPLRLACFERDKGRCTDCGKSTYLEKRYDTDPDAFHMAHIRTKRNNGDTLENVRCKCMACHRKEHGGC